jgi:DNA-binding response OmpR family regulator
MRPDTTWLSEATVTEHIRRLRMKLGYGKSCDCDLAMVRGVGHRFEP